MPNNFFYIILDNELTRFEKNRIISIEPYEFGTKIILEASHAAEEPLIFFSSEAYDKVMSAYLS